MNRMFFMGKQSRAGLDTIYTAVMHDIGNCGRMLQNTVTVLLVNTIIIAGNHADAHNYFHLEASVLLSWGFIHHLDEWKRGRKAIASIIQNEYFV